MLINFLISCRCAARVLVWARQLAVFTGCSAGLPLGSCVNSWPGWKNSRVYVICIAQASGSANLILGLHVSRRFWGCLVLPPCGCCCFSSAYYSNSPGSPTLSDHSHLILTSDTFKQVKLFPGIFFISLVSSDLSIKCSC